METAQSVKARLLELEAQRKAIEQQIEECSSRLNAPGGAGLTASLVDKEVRASSSSTQIYGYFTLQVQVRLDSCCGTLSRT